MHVILLSDYQAKERGVTVLNNIMSEESELILNAAIGSVYLELLALGFRVEDSSDFEEFKAICQLRDIQSVGAHADDKLFDLTSANSFFMAVFDRENNLVATVSAMYDDLKKGNLAQFWQKRLPRLYGGKIERIRSPAALEISGRVVYLGDLWVKKGNPANGIGLLLPRLALLYTLNKFKPDFCYALHRPRDAIRRSMEIGFAHTQRRAIQWASLPADFNEEYWISYAKSADLHHLAFSLVEKIHQKTTM